MTTVALADLDAAAGSDLGVSRWIDISQSRIDAFAESTEDRQWIHVDADRASGGPFGTTIAHGFLTLSLLSAMATDLLHVTGIAMGVNYGFDKVRFTAPVPVGSRVRGAGRLAAVTEVPGGKQVRLEVGVEVEGAPKPACVAEWLVRYYAATP